MAELKRHALTRYQQRLGSLPPSGGGGCHQALLGCATLGVRAGVRPEQVCQDLRRSVRGTRNVTDREIGDAVSKAINGRHSTAGIPRQRWRQPPRPTGRAFDAATFLANRLAESKSIDEADIWDASPIRIDTPPEGDAALLIETLYRTDDILFMGDTYGRTVKTAADWLASFRAGRPVPPHLIPNPLTGNVGLTKDGRPSLRADACVKSFRFAVAEFDGMNREDQIRFWWAVNLPVCALIDSGGKSLHAWIRIDGIETSEDWTELVEESLFRRYLIPLGCDAACRNEARLSRLVGHFRKEKGRWQRLLYLAPEGRAIHAGA